ncbi:hypothetical protein B0J17DRAFT_640870 [Rhizoctonia solani]|nr:hypothetical protein B0J17DRAFT_640870 [Rhizoctonia solani]
MAAPLDTFSWHSETLSRALVARSDCDILTELIVLRDQGNASKNVDTHFEKAREKTRNTDEIEKSFATAYDNAMENINRMVWIPRTFNFLDLGSAPGGFTQYLLRKNRRAHGMGISLPREQGGNGFAVTYSDYLARYELHWADLTTFDLAPSIPKPATANHDYPPLPFEPGSRDLVLCDAQWVLNPDNLKRPLARGNIFIRLSCVERTLTGRILLALCRISDLVRTVKSTQFQAVRSYFYVLAQRVHPQSNECKELISALERLWYTMTFEGENGYGRDISAKDEELITTDEEMLGEKGLSTIIQLGTPIWEIQYDALCHFLSRRGVV